MKSGTLSLIRLLIVLAIVTSCAQGDSTVRVHMINAHSGSPISNKSVRLWTREIPEERNYPGYVRQVTNSAGVATFDLTDPIPSYLYIHIGMGRRWEECFPDTEGFVARDILDSGVSRETRCWRLPNIASKFEATPGNVYIFAVHDSLFDFLSELLFGASRE